MDDVARVSKFGTKATELKSAKKKHQFGPEKFNILTIAHKNAKIVETK